MVINKTTIMSYHIQTTIKNKSFDDAINQVTAALKAESFGVLTDIDIKATLKEKLGEDFRNYRILGACNPPYAFEALKAEDKIGAMLPCNVVVDEKSPGHIEVAAVDPMASMQAVENDELSAIAKEIKDKLQRVIDSLS